MVTPSTSATALGREEERGKQLGKLWFPEPPWPKPGAGRGVLDKSHVLENRATALATGRLVCLSHWDWLGGLVVVPTACEDD